MLEVALTESVFLNKHLPHVPAERINAFRTELRRMTDTQVVRNPQSLLTLRHRTSAARMAAACQLAQQYSAFDNGCRLGIHRWRPRQCP